MHVAMWSGPRNLSTAMMYAFAQRTGLDVVDEPFYAAYLRATELDHPMRGHILSTMETDPEIVADSLRNAVALYSKQMTHHMLGGFPRGWFASARHAFLIRHPARVVASYAVKRERPTPDDLGFRQQAEIFDDVRGLGQEPVVVDSFDVRSDPEGTLRKLCAALDLEWQPGMLSWPKGGHPRDGVWAAHWYAAVHASTGFASAEGALPEVATELRHLVEDAMPHYERLAALKL